MNFETWYEAHYDQLREDWIEDGCSISLYSWAMVKFKERDE